MLATLAARSVLSQDSEHVGVLGKDLGHQRRQTLPHCASGQIGEKTACHSVMAPRSRDFKAHLGACFVHWDEGSVSDELTARR